MPAPDGGDDFVGVFGPVEGARDGVGVGKETVDGGLEISEAKRLAIHWQRQAEVLELP